MRRKLFRNLNQINTNFPQTGLVAYYKLDEISGTTVYDYVGSNNGTSTNTTLGQPGVFNTSHYYPATDSPRILIPSSEDFIFSDASGDIPFSISIRVKFEVNKNVFLITKSSGGTRTWEITFGGNVLYGRIASLSNMNNKIERRFPFTPTLNQWYHIIMTYDGSGLADGIKLYIDLAEGGTSHLIGSYSEIGNSDTLPIYIGHWSASTTYDHQGWIDEVGIWKNHVLTEAERTLVNSNRP